MSWRDQEYNSGQGEISSYFANPEMLLRMSLPIYRSAGLSIRVHFWFLLFAVFHVLDVVRFKEPLFYIPLDLGIMLAAVLFHEFGHRIFARGVGGDHADWIVWPSGGMVPPSVPHTAKATLLANSGGIVFSLALGVVAYAALRLIPGTTLLYSIQPDPFRPLFLDANSVPTHALALVVTTCVAISVINLFPAYWFDGGYIWQSLLWPKLGLWKATLVTCIAGMILAVPFFVLSLLAGNFFGMIVWFLIFSDCFTRRKALAATGPGMMDEEEGSYQYMDTPSPRRKKMQKRFATAARKRARLEQIEQARIDAILAKVKEKGLHSLTWGEKRALKQATARQRERDLARRR